MSTLLGLPAFLTSFLALSLVHAQVPPEADAPQTTKPGPMQSIDDETPDGSSPAPASPTECTSPSPPVRPAMIPFDPTAPAAAPGPLPSASRPSLDVLGATASFNTSGTKGTLVFAPIALFADHYWEVLSETRVELRTGFGDTQSFGGSLSLGYSTSGRLSADQWKAMQEFASSIGCEAFAKRQAELEPKVAALKAFLLGRPSTQGCASVGSDTATDFRGAILVACFKDHKEHLSTDDRQKGEDLVTDYLEEAEESTAKIEDATLAQVRSNRLEVAFKNALIFSAKAGVDTFPLVSGPEITEDDGSKHEPIPKEFNSFAATLSMAYFLNEHVGVWLTGGVEEQRPTPTDPVSTRLVGSIEGAWNLPLGEADENGFRSGIALGVASRWSACQESGGCKEKVLGYKDSIAAEDVVAAITFLDVRLSSTVQFRLAIPLTYYRLSDDRTDGEERIITIVPTLATSVSKWKTEVN